MRYTVVWSNSAQNELTEIWLSAAADRAQITKAAHQVDQELGTHPEANGVEFYGDRLLVVPPLQLVFNIRANDRIVEILHVW
jgi:plasmid stabilization system protein ParE